VWRDVEIVGSEACYLRYAIYMASAAPAHASLDGLHAATSLKARRGRAAPRGVAARCREERARHKKGHAVHVGAP
jgi:hypothetical protein